MANIDSTDGSTNKNPEPIDQEIFEKDIHTIIQELNGYLEKHKFSNRRTVANELVGLMGVWKWGNSDSSPRGSDNTKSLVKLEKSAKRLSRQLSLVELWWRQLLESHSAPSKDELNFELLATQLSQLSHSTNIVLRSIEQKPTVRAQSRQALDFIVEHLYSMYTESTGKTDKYTRNPYSDDKETQYSGGFFLALKDFYKLLGITKSDHAIRADIDRLSG